MGLRTYPLSQAGGSYPLQSHPGAGHCRRWHALGLVRDVEILRWGWFEMSARGRGGGWLVRDVGGVLGLSYQARFTRSKNGIGGHTRCVNSLEVKIST